jgi:Uma2 family endonuclease
MTVTDLEAMPDDGNRYEVIEGELFVSRAPGLTHQQVSTNLVYLIRLYLEKNPIGVVVATPGLILSEFSGVIPDIVFFRHGRREEIVSGERLTGAPDLVIEILSPGVENKRRDRIAKRQLYARYAVPEYWVVDLGHRTVEVYHLHEESLEMAHMFSLGDEVTSSAMPGFVCAAESIFQQ